MVLSRSRKTVLQILNLLVIYLFMIGAVAAQNKVVVVPMFDQKQIFTGVAKTGSTVCTTPGAGDHWVAISCANVGANLLGQDAETKVGAQQSPRFKDNANGTVTDRLTGLIWFADAFCAQTLTNWPTALAFVIELNSVGEMDSNDCGDTSNAGGHRNDWRLPNVKELQSLLNYGDHGSPYISDLAGTGHYTDNPPFTDLQVDSGYWSSTTYGVGTGPLVDDDFYDNAMRVNFDEAASDGTGKGVGTVTGAGEHVWAVRGGI